MNLGLAAATFGLVALAELPDKTFIATVVFSARHRTIAVWIGSAAGLVVQAVLGVVAGRLLRLLPHTAVEAVVTGLFFVGAAYLLLSSEPNAEADGDKLAGEKEPEPPSKLRIGLTTFGVVTLAEFGDLTQVLIANLVASFGDLWSVFLGAALAFVAVSGAAVALLGATIERVVPLRTIRRVSGVLLVGLGIWSLVELLR